MNPQDPILPLLLFSPRASRRCVKLTARGPSVWPQQPSPPAVEMGMMISPGCMRRGPYSVRLPVLDGLAARALQSGISTVV